MKYKSFHHNPLELLRKQNILNYFIELLWTDWWELTMLNIIIFIFADNINSMQLVPMNNDSCWRCCYYITHVMSLYHARDIFVCWFLLFPSCKRKIEMTLHAKISYSFSHIPMMLYIFEILGALSIQLNKNIWNIS